MKDMAQTGGGPMSFCGSLPDRYKVAINGNHPIVDKILKAEGEEAQTKVAKQAFDLALLCQGLLTAMVACIAPLTKTSQQPVGSAQPIHTYKTSRFVANSGARFAKASSPNRVIC